MVKLVKDKTPLKNPHANGDFSLLILAFPLHNSLEYIRYFYLYRAMLPVWKIYGDFFHKEKRLRSKNSSSAPRLEETRSRHSIWIIIPESMHTSANFVRIFCVELEKSFDF